MSTEEIGFAFLGDLCLGTEFIAHADKTRREYLYPFESLLSVFSDVDIGFANLEGPAYQGTELRPKVSVHLSNHPIILDFLNQNKFKGVSLANNHILDMGKTGLEKTIILLKKAKLVYVGAGMNSYEAEREEIYECKGRRMSFYSFTTDESHVNSIIANSDQPGCASLKDINRICNLISYSKKNVGLVCVFLHWGFEYFQYPSSTQVEVAHKLVDAGANFVIGHHPHVIQGIEMYNGALIAYSLGNFFFPPVRANTGRLQYQKKDAREFIILKAKVSKSEEIAYRIVGGKIDKDYNCIVFDDFGQTEVFSRIRDLSAPLRLQDYNKYWMGYKSLREKELQKEGFIEAYKKFLKLPTKDKIKTISLRDIKRNILRLKKLLLNSK
jgi:hypothetical protein